MIDLKSLQADIDKMWENETSDSLSNWLFQKRLSNINLIIGEGEFVSIATKNANITFTTDNETANFESDNPDFDPVPSYRSAA